MYYTSKEVYEYISQATNDPIVKWESCAVSGQPFAIYQSDLDFYAKVSPTFDGQKFPIPTPTLCPEERQRRRLSFRNERKLYKRKCDFSGKDIISIYSPDKPYKVYDQKVRWSGQRDPMSYGRDFDFSKSFTEQFGNILMEVPKMDTLKMNTEKCDYNNIIGNSKNCYMCSTTFQSENCYYSYWCVESKNSFDNYSILQSELLYECTNCNTSYNTKYSENCTDCTNSYYLFNCSGCNNCFLCSNLNNKEYYILNKAYSKESYLHEINKINSGGWEEVQKIFKDLKKQTTRECFFSNNSSDCTGNYIFDSKSCRSCFNIIDGEDIKYCYDSAVSLKDSMDMSMIGDVVELMLEAQASGYNGYRSSFVNFCWTGKELYYCDYCMYCKNCFGCVGLKNHEYCIFNKQYSKEDYEVQVAKIISHMQETGEWGEFFHPSLSPFGYNETVSQEYYPMEKVGAHIHAGGDNHKDYSPYGYKRSDYNVDPIIAPGSKVVDRKNIMDAPTHDDEILQSIFICEVSGRPFRIIKQELEFYRKHNLPLPRRHPDQRHADRMALRAPREIHLSTCDKCDQEMISVYEKPNDNKVYCESCYQKEMYS